MVNFEELRKNVDRLYDLLFRLGYHIPLRTGSIISELNYYVGLHNNNVKLSTDGQFLTLLSAAVPTTVPRIDSSVDILHSLVGATVPRLILANFSNQSMHLFAEICYLAVNFGKQNLYEIETESLFDEFAFLQRLFAREFVFEPSKTRENFESVLKRCVQAKIFERSTNNGGVLACGTSTDVKVLKRLFEPWLICYYICVDFMQNSTMGVDAKQFCRVIQEEMAKKLTNDQRNEPRWYQIMSMDTLKNALASFVDLGAVSNVKSSINFESNILLYQSDVERLSKIKMRLEKYLSNCFTSEEYSEHTKIKSKM